MTIVAWLQPEPEIQYSSIHTFLLRADSRNIKNTPITEDSYA